MSYLITNHDYKHLHAISGLIAILNFIYNIYNLIIYNSNKLTIYLVFNNLLLALLSLQFKLPEKRPKDVSLSNSLLKKKLRYKLIEIKDIIKKLYNKKNN